MYKQVVAVPTVSTAFTPSCVCDWQQAEEEERFKENEPSER